MNITAPAHFAIPASDGQSAILCQPHHPGTVVRITRHTAGTEYLVSCRPVEGAFGGGRSVTTVELALTSDPTQWYRQWGTGTRHAAGADLTEALRDAVLRVTDVWVSDNVR